jgi:hypothetical protein
MMRTALCLSGFLAWAVPTALPATYVVAPDGADSNPGTLQRPFATLQRAQEAVRQTKGTVLLRGGTYYLSQPLVLTARDSGTREAPVVYQAYENEKPVISGGVRLTDLHWQPYQGGILKTQVPADLKTEEIFVNGERQVLARYPNFNSKARYFDGFAADAISKERASRWADPRGGYFHAMHPALWGDFTWIITGKDANGEVLKEGGWQNNRGGAIHAEIRFVENIFEELDAPGEWYLNPTTHTLYFYPPAGLDLKTATVEATCLRTLVEFRGDETNPVRFVRLKGLTFRQAARTVMDTKEPLLRTDWAIYRGGAIFFNGAEDCSLEDAVIDQVGGNAVFVNNYNRRIAILGSLITKAGASGIAFVGDQQAARSPLFNYSQVQNLDKIDPTPGPQTNNYPANCLVDNCLITLTGRVEKQTAGVEIDLAQDITVRHCSIYDMPRAGINIGDGCWGGHVIEFCDVFDTVRETGDHGSFNSWGRDRYWRSNISQVNQWIGKIPGFPFLDVVKPNIIRNSRWRCDHGWDIDLDDGSSHYEIYNNLLLKGGLKLREGYGRKVYNNIMANNGLHAHVWFNASGDEFFSNIVMKRHSPAGMPAVWGTRVDDNLFTTSEADRTAFLNQGCDKNSLVGDPLFVDPAHGDFTVKTGSPALKIGFKNFPMDQFGVQTPALKSITRTPEIPALAKTQAPTTARKTGSWLGAELGELAGEEFSAFGVSRESGGVHLVKVEPGSPAAAAGLRDHDLIQGVNGSPVKSIADLAAAVQSAAGKPLTLSFVRDQQTLSLTVKSQTPVTK